MVYGSKKARFEDIEPWKEKIRAAVASGLSAAEFKILHDIGEYEYQVFLRSQIGKDPALTFRSNNVNKGKKIPKKTGRGAKPKYQQMLIPDTPVEQPVGLLPRYQQADGKPLYCLMLTFASKEEQLAAMGRFL